MKMCSALAVAAAAGLATSAAQAQVTITPVVIEGQQAGSVGLVTTIDNVAVNDAGQWIVESDTDALDTEADGVLIKNGNVYLQEGQALTLPSGTTLDSFDSITLNDNGDSGWNFFLDGNVTTGTDSGIFFNDVLVFQEGTFYAGDELSANTPYIGFFETKINDTNQILVLASVDDPEIASTVDRALVVVSYDALAGTYTESLIAAEGHVLPGVTEPVLDFGTSPEEFAFNDAGDAIFVADLDTGLTTNDLALFRTSGGAITLIAREGDASPAAGRSWSSLTSLGVDLNSAGNYVFTGSLDGDTASNLVIVKDGAVFKQEGGAVPGVAGFTLESFGTAPIVQIGDNGSVLWYGDWNDTDTTVDSGLFLDDTLLIQEGVTVVDGAVVDTIASGQDGFMLSDSGEYAIVELTLVDGRSVAALLQFAGSTCPADFDGDGSLTLNDFVQFRNAYVAGDLRADFDGNGSLSLNDFVTFRNAYVAGCP